MADNSFVNTVESLFKGMDSFMTTKTVVGEAIKVDENTTILPLVDVSFGVGAGAFSNEDKKSNNGGGGMSGKMTPSSVLIIQNGTAKVVNVNVKEQDGISKIIDMVPEIINNIKGKKEERQSSEQDLNDDITD